MAEATGKKDPFRRRILKAALGRKHGCRSSELCSNHSEGEGASSSASSPNSVLTLRAHTGSQVELPIIPAPAKRGWMDETNAGFANRCLPLLMANQWGWFILNDRAIRLIWNGGPALNDLQIQYHVKNLQERVRPETLLAVSHFGHGILTWRIPFLFETPPGWNLYVRGPANWYKDGICPLDGVVETDWSSATFTMNWKVTRPETWIAFEESEPICMIFPVPRGSVEQFSPEILLLSQNPELEKKHVEWRRSREQFSRDLHSQSHGSETKAPWQKHYVRGMSVLGEIFPEHQTKLALRQFRDLRVKAKASKPEPPTPEIAQKTPELPGVDFNVVVCSENNSYMGWQTQLFCFSSITRLKKHPTVVVHCAEPLLPEFKTVASWGCKVIEAPQFRQHPLRDYPARNELGSLLTISEIPDFCQGHVLFCEPDMLFVKKLAYSGELSGEYYSYLDYRQPRLEPVARKFGLTDPLENLNETSRIGVPYLIPGPILPRIARRWIEVLDAFEEIDWIDIMYAFGLALAIENLPIKATHHMTDNENSLRPVHGGLIHYCYGDRLWNKRLYWGGGTPLQAPPIQVPRQMSGTVVGEILRQIREARACSQYPRLLKNPKFLARMFPK